MSIIFIEDKIKIIDNEILLSFNYDLNDNYIYLLSIQTFRHTFPLGKIKINSNNYVYNTDLKIKNNNLYSKLNYKVPIHNSHKIIKSINTKFNNKIIRLDDVIIKNRLNNILIKSEEYNSLLTLNNKESTKIELTDNINKTYKKNENKGFIILEIFSNNPDYLYNRNQYLIIQNNIEENSNLRNFIVNTNINQLPVKTQLEYFNN